MTTTSADIKVQVQASLAEWVIEYDVDGIVTAIIEKYGLVHIDTIPSEEYWPMVARFDLAPVDYDA